MQDLMPWAYEKRLDLNLMKKGNRAKPLCDRFLKNSL